MWDMEVNHLLLVRLMGQYCFARWWCPLSVGVGVCNAAGGRALMILLLDFYLFVHACIWP